jgi:hypothetical protein
MFILQIFKRNNNTSILEGAYARKPWTKTVKMPYPKELIINDCIECMTMMCDWVSIQELRGDEVAPRKEIDEHLTCGRGEALTVVLF